MKGYWQHFWVVGFTGSLIGASLEGEEGAVFGAAIGAAVGLLSIAIRARARILELEQRVPLAKPRLQILEDEIQNWQAQGYLSPSLAKVLRRASKIPDPSSTTRETPFKAPGEPTRKQPVPVSGPGTGAAGPARVSTETAPQLHVLGEPVLQRPSQSLVSSSADRPDGLPALTTLGAGAMDASTAEGVEVVEAGLETSRIGEHSVRQRAEELEAQVSGLKSEAVVSSQVDMVSVGLAARTMERFAAEPQAEVAAAERTAASEAVLTSSTTPELGSKEDLVVQHHSAWNRLLRPLLYENFILFIGAFLILSGSVFGIADNWNRAGEWRPVLVVGAMMLYAHLFFGVGYLLARKALLRPVGLSILGIGVLLLPFQYIGISLLSVGFPVLALASGTVLAALDLACLLVAGGLHHRPTGWRFAVAFLALCGSHALAGSVTSLGSIGQPVLLSAIFLALYFGALRPFVREHLAGILVDSARAVVFYLGSLVFVFLTVAGHLHFLQGTDAGTGVASAYGPLLVLLGMVALDVHFALLEHPERAQHHELWRGLALGASVVGVLLAFTEFPSAAAPVATFLATVLLVRAQLVQPRPLHLYGALGLSLLAYYSSPALFSQLALAVLQNVSEAAGYDESRLPVSYYALTFLPYVLAIGSLAVVRHRRGLTFWPMLGWATGVSVVALLLVWSTPWDRRPALPAVLVYGLLGLEVYRRWGFRGYLVAALVALPLAVELGLALAGEGPELRLMAFSGVVLLLCGLCLAGRRTILAQTALEVGLASGLVAAGLSPLQASTPSGMLAGVAAALAFATGARVTGSLIWSMGMSCVLLYLGWQLGWSVGSSEMSAAAGGIGAGLLLVGLWHVSERWIRPDPRNPGPALLGLLPWPWPASSERVLWSLPAASAATLILVLVVLRFGVEGPSREIAEIGIWSGVLSAALVWVWPVRAFAWIAACAWVWSLFGILPEPPKSGLLHGLGGMALIWWMLGEGTLRRASASKGWERLGQVALVAGGLLSILTLVLWEEAQGLRLLRWGIVGQDVNEAAIRITLGMGLLALILATGSVPSLLFAYATCAAVLGLSLESYRQIFGGIPSAGWGLAVGAAVLYLIGRLLDRAERPPLSWWPRYPRVDSPRIPARAFARFGAAIAGPAFRCAAGLALLAGCWGATLLGSRMLMSAPILGLAGLVLLLVVQRRPRLGLALSGWLALGLAGHDWILHVGGHAWSPLGLVLDAAVLTGMALVFRTEWVSRSFADSRAIFGRSALWVAWGFLAAWIVLHFDLDSAFPLLLQTHWGIPQTLAALLATCVLLLQVRLVRFGWLASIPAAVTAFWGGTALFLLVVVWPGAWKPLESASLMDLRSAEWALSLKGFAIAGGLLALCLAGQRVLSRWSLGLLTGAAGGDLSRLGWNWALLGIGLGFAGMLSVFALEAGFSWGPSGPLPPGHWLANGGGTFVAIWREWVGISVLTMLCLDRTGRRLGSSLAIPGLLAAGCLAVVSLAGVGQISAHWTGLAVVLVAAVAWELALRDNLLVWGRGWAWSLAPSSWGTVLLTDLSFVLILFWGVSLPYLGPRSHGPWSSPALGLEFAILGASAFLIGLRRQWPRLVGLALFCAFQSGCWLLIWYGLAYPTGRPPAAILPFFGVIAFALAELALALRQRFGEPRQEVSPCSRGARFRAFLSAARPDLKAASVLLEGFALAFVAGAAGLLQQDATGKEAVAISVLLAITVWLALVRGCRQERAGQIHKGFALGLLLVVYLRWLSPWSPRWPVEVDAGLWMLLGFLLLGLGKAGPGPAIFRQAALSWALVCPLGLLPWFDNASPRSIGIGAIGAGILYVAIAFETQRRSHRLLAALVLNTGLLLWLSDLQLNHLSVYGLPVGATLLLLVQIESETLSRSTRFQLQNVGMAIVCGSAAGDTFLAQDLFSFLLLLGLCLGGLFLGLGLRIRSFVFCSTGILVATILGQLIRGSIELAMPLYLLLTSLGIVLLGLTAFVSWKRQQILSWYRLMTDDFTRWS